MKNTQAALLVTIALLILLAAASDRASTAPPPQASEPASEGFKVTIGLRTKYHNRSLAGVVRTPARIRSIQGWRLGDQDVIKPPQRWDMRLRMLWGNMAPKALILDVLPPAEQPVVLYIRGGDIKFVPADIPYGKVYYPPTFNKDITVERVPIPQIVSSREFEDDDPAILRTRQGDYWLAWVAYKTRQRNGYFYEGGDQIMVSHSRDAGVWSRPEAITPPGDHFRVALGEDADGHIWCVYALQKQMESGNFDLYARFFDGDRWSGEKQLTRHPLPDAFHKMATDRQGNLYLAWMGFRPGPAGGPPQSDILLRALKGGAWGPEVNVSQSQADDWGARNCG